MSGEVPQLQVRDGQSDDGRLVQLRRDGPRKWKHLRQLVELEVLLTATRSRGVARFLLPDLEDAAEIRENTRIRHTCAGKMGGGGWKYFGQKLQLVLERFLMLSSSRENGMRNELNILEGKNKKSSPGCFQS